jgi:hypothetical protein
MIAQQSLAVAIVPKGHPINSRRHTRVFQRRVRSAFISSPEGTAEILEFRASLELGDWDLDGPSLFLLPSWVPSKANQTYPNLSHRFLEIKDCLFSRCTPVGGLVIGNSLELGCWDLDFLPIRFGHLWSATACLAEASAKAGRPPAYASLCNLTQGYASHPPRGVPNHPQISFCPHVTTS